MNENSGRFLKQLRKEKKLSQEKLAEMICTDRSNISRWENGNGTIPLNQIEKICEIFSIQVLELICGERINNLNYIESNKKIVNLIREKNNKFKKLKLGLLANSFIILILLIIFLLYYFFQTFNTEKIYNILLDSEKYSLSNGLLVLTREELYFKIGTIDNENKKIELYYKDTLIYSGESDDLLIDYLGYNNYFDVKKMKKNLDNYYIKINNDKIGLKFNLMYKNNSLFKKSNEYINENDQYEESEKNVPSRILELFKCDDIKCEYNDNSMKYIYDIKTGNFTIIGNDIYIIDNFELNTFNLYINDNNYLIYNGEIDKQFEDYNLIKDLYDKYYKKIQKKYFEKM